MSSEQAFTLALITALISGIVTPLITKWFERRKTKSEEELNIAQAAGDIIEGGDKAIAAFERLLNRYEQKNQLLEQKIDSQNQEISNLNARITAQQIDQREKESRWNAKFQAFEEYVALLVNILRENGIEIPPRPDILKESQTKIQSIK